MANFEHALDFALRSRGLSLREIQRRLALTGNRVSIGTLSNWRTGRHWPEGAQSLVALAELERILGVEEGALASLLGPSRRTGQAPPVGKAFPDEVVDAAVAETRAILGADAPHQLRALSQSAHVRTDERGSVRHYALRALTQVTTGTVSAFPFVFTILQGSPAPPELGLIAGGRITDQHIHRSGAVVGARVELDAPVRAPDTFMVEYEARMPEMYPVDRSVSLGVMRRVRDLTIWVSFLPGALPDRAVVRLQTDDGVEEHPLAPSGLSLHHTVSGFGPGLFEIRWAPDGAELP
ncbi:hypothetical protein [Brachybacterium hainanense]|uniref:HTH cro/C1-type domain-containing protein n=1 Tax=Brachybacterium hainanense TaxID=1541174 RepID=A0ABV6R9Z3_9MICO